MRQPGVHASRHPTAPEAIAEEMVGEGGEGGESGGDGGSGDGGGNMHVSQLTSVRGVCRVG